MLCVLYLLRGGHQARYHLHRFACLHWLRGVQQLAGAVRTGAQIAGAEHRRVKWRECQRQWPHLAMLGLVHLVDVEGMVGIAAGQCPPATPASG